MSKKKPKSTKLITKSMQCPAEIINFLTEIDNTISSFMPLSNWNVALPDLEIVGNQLSMEFNKLESKFTFPVFIYNDLCDLLGSVYNIGRDLRLTKNRVGELNAKLEALNSSAETKWSGDWSKSDGQK